MKYLNLKIADFISPSCRKNLIEAIQFIGEKNPLQIKRHNLNKKVKNSKNCNNYFNRGVLNIRKRLNGHLGLNGKFSNNMIKFAAKISVVNSADRITLGTKIAHQYYLQIVTCIYEMLYEIDVNKCEELFAVENKDNYLGKTRFSDIKLKTVAPIQTGIIMSSVGNKYSSKSLEALQSKIR